MTLPDFDYGQAAPVRPGPPAAEALPAGRAGGDPADRAAVAPPPGHSPAGGVNASAGFPRVV